MAVRPKLKITHTVVVLYKAVFLIMYYACSRIGEALTICTIPWSWRTFFFPVVPFTTKLFLYSPRIKIPIGQQNFFCRDVIMPYTVQTQLINYLAVRPGSLFVNGKGACISSYTVNKVLQDYLKERGYDTTRFNTHSIRAGWASDLAIKRGSGTFRRCRFGAAFSALDISAPGPFGARTFVFRFVFL